jgi:hypothetical protein
MWRGKFDSSIVLFLGPAAAVSPVNAGEAFWVRQPWGAAADATDKFLATEISNLPCEPSLIQRGVYRRAPQIMRDGSLDFSTAIS